MTIQRGETFTRELGRARDRSRGDCRGTASDQLSGRHAQHRCLSSRSLSSVETAASSNITSTRRCADKSSAVEQLSPRGVRPCRLEGRRGVGRLGCPHPRRDGPGRRGGPGVTMALLGRSIRDRAGPIGRLGHPRPTCRGRRLCPRPARGRIGAGRRTRCGRSLVPAIAAAHEVVGTGGDRAPGWMAANTVGFGTRVVPTRIVLVTRRLPTSFENIRLLSRAQRTGRREARLSDAPR